MAFGRFTMEMANARVVIDYAHVAWVCADFTATNAGSNDRMPSTSDFTMVRPSGAVSSNGSVTVDSGSGVTHVTDFMFPILVPGGTATVTMCFRSETERGRVMVRYQPAAGKPQEWPLDF